MPWDLRWAGNILRGTGFTARRGPRRSSCYRTRLLEQHRMVAFQALYRVGHGARRRSPMRKLLIALAVMAVAVPTVALAQHRGGNFHGGGFHRGGGHWDHGRWIPWAVGAGIIGGAVIANESCYRWVVDQWGYQRRVWVC